MMNNNYIYDDNSPYDRKFQGTYLLIIFKNQGEYSKLQTIDGAIDL